MRPLRIALASALVLTSAATGAGAGPEVDGLAVNATSANRNVNAAVGVFATARQTIGTVNGELEVNGSLVNATNANNNANVSTGIGSRSGARKR